jgi:hypothetical protein
MICTCSDAKFDASPQVLWRAHDVALPWPLHMRGGPSLSDATTGCCSNASVKILKAASDVSHSFLRWERHVSLKKNTARGA